MLASIMYFIKFSHKHNPKYLFFSITEQLLNSAVIILGIFMPKIIVDELFVKHNSTNSFIAGVILVFGGMLLKLLSNVMSINAINEKNELQSSWI